MSAEQGVLIATGEAGEAAAPTPPLGKGKPRLKRVERQQMVWRAIDVERLIDADHPARAIWELLGKLDLGRFVAGIKAVEGRPGRDRSDPRVVIALWLYALSRGVREARALDAWAQYEPGCQWLLGLGRLNYHTLADFVTAQAAALDQLFVDLLHVLMSEGLADLERVAHDGTKIHAAASSRSFRRAERLAECRKQAEEHLAALDREGRPEASAARRKAQQRAAQERVERLRAAEEELKRQQAERAAVEQATVRVSTTEPEARRMRQADGGFAPSYNAQISTDSAHGVIVGYDASQAQEDSHELAAALERIAQNTGRAPQQVLVDGGYTTRQNIMATAEGPTELIGSLGQDRSKNQQQRHGVTAEFLSQRFVWDAAQNCFTCPAGKVLAYKSRKRLVGAIEKHYRARPGDCQVCPFRAQCCPQTKGGRLVIRAEEDPKVAAFRQKMQGPEYHRIYRQRAQVAEFSNACVKAKRGLRQFLRRGLTKVRTELAWACLSCNVAIWTRRVWKVSRQVATAPTCV
jgi:transposase